MVDRDGRRFVNEADSYHNVALAMLEKPERQPCFLICDARSLKKYGIGMVRPGSRATPYLRDGYLIKAHSIDDLASKLGVPTFNLKETILLMNHCASSGIDPSFHRGSTPYHRHNGDSKHGPNPTLGPISSRPFYAIRLYPGEIGAATGLLIDEWGQLLDRNGEKIPKLYACGNDAHSIMGGTYPGPGITLGPAITFAYRAVEDVFSRLNGRAPAPARDDETTS